MSVSYWVKNSNDIIKKDIVIIGGGITGVSAAYWLSKLDNSLDIAILEKHQLADGATGRSAGFITCGSVEHFNRMVQKHGKKQALDIWRFSEENLKLLKEHIVKDNGEKILFEENGSFSLASTKEEMSELENTTELMDSMGIEVENLSASDITKRLGVINFQGGIKYCRDAAVHPVLLVKEIESQIKEYSNHVETFENHEVYSIERINEDKLIKTSKNDFQATIVILALNGYSSQLFDYFSDKIFPTRGQILSTTALPKFMEGPCYANFVLDYFRQLPSGELLIGGFRQLQKDVEVGYSDETTNIIQDALEKFLHKHITAHKDLKIVHRWSGIMGFSVDGQPLIGTLPSDPKICFLGGFTAHGLGLAFHAAKVLSDMLISDTKVPNFFNARRL